MKKQQKKITYQTEEQKEMLHFFIVLVVVIACVISVYFLSKLFVMDKSLFEVSYNNGAINSERAIVGTMLNRPEKEYYVFVYDEKATNAVYYSSVSTNYTQNQENALKVYHVDLSNPLNKDYFVGDSGVSNPNAKKVSDFKFKGITLLRIKNGKVEKYIEDEASIQKELAVTKKKNS